MDEEERKRKLLAAKEKLAEFQRKKGSMADSGVKKKKKKKIQTGCTSVGLDTQSSEEKSEEHSQSLPMSVVCTESQGFSLDLTSAVDSLPPDIQDVAEAFVEASDSDTPQLMEQNMNLAKIEEYNKKLQEYHNALMQRNDVISQLTERLRITIEQRDKLQSEASMQADTLAREIETLKLQLQQANEFLLNQKGKNGISAQELLEAKNQTIALRQDNLQKDSVIESLQRHLENMHSEHLTYQVATGTELDRFKKQLDVTASQLQLNDERMREKDSESQNLNMQLQQQLSENEKLLLQAKHFETEWLSSKKMCQDLQNERVLLQELLKKNEEENAAVHQRYKEELLNISNELQTSKKLLEESKVKSSDEVRDLMQQLENIHKKAAHSDMEGKAIIQQLDALRAELDEQYGHQIAEMKQEIVRRHQSELEHLKSELAEVTKEKQDLYSRLYSTSGVDEGISRGVDFSATLSLSPNTSFSSEVELWQEKARMANSEKESSETSFKTQLNFVNENVQALMEENRALKLSYSEAAHSLKEKNALIENMMHMRNEGSETIEVIPSERKALEEFEALKCEFGILRDSSDTLKSELDDAIFRLSNVNSENSQLEEVRTQLEQDLLDARHAVSDLQHLLEDEVRQKLVALRDYEELNHKFDVQAEELRVAFQQLLELKHTLDELGSAKQSSEAELLRVKQELLLKNKLFDTVHEKLGITNKQLNELQQQRDELERVYNAEVDQRSTDWDISINFGDVVKQFNELRAENDRLRTLVGSSAYGDSRMVGTNIAANSSKSGGSYAIHSEWRGSDSVDWKSKYDILLQEKLELEVELQTSNMDTGIVSEQKGYDMPMLTDEAGGDSGAAGKYPFEFLVNQMMESSSSVDMIDKTEAGTDIPSLLAEIEFLKSTNGQRQQEVEEQKSKLSGLMSLMKQETELRELEAKKNAVLMADLAALRDEICSLNARCDDAESAKVSLKSKVISLQEACDECEQKVEEFKKGTVELELQLSTLQLRYEQATAELRAAEVELTQLRSQVADDSSIDAVKKKLESMVEEQEMKGIVVKHAYVLGSDEEAKEFQAQEENSKLEQLLNEIEQGSKVPDFANANAAGWHQEIAGLKIRLEEEGAKNAKLEAVVAELRENGFSVERKLVQLEGQNELLEEQLHAERAKVLDSLSSQQQLYHIQTRLQDADAARESLQMTISELLQKCGFYEQKANQVEADFTALQAQLRSLKLLHQECAAELVLVREQLERGDASCPDESVEILRLKLEKAVAEQEKLGIIKKEAYIVGGNRHKEHAEDLPVLQDEIGRLRTVIQLEKEARLALEAHTKELQEECMSYKDRLGKLEEHEGAAAEHERRAGSGEELKSTCVRTLLDEDNSLQTQLDSVSSLDFEEQGQKCDLQRLVARMRQNASQDMVGDFATLQQELSNLEIRLRNESTSKLTLESSVSNLQKMCDVYEHKLNQLVADCNVLERQLHDERRGHQQAVKELNKLRDSETFAHGEDVESLRNRLETAVARQEMEAIKVQTAYVLGSSEDPANDSQSTDLDSETPAMENAILLHCLEKEKQTNAHLLNEFKRLRTASATDGSTASPEDAFASSVAETPRKKKKKVQFAEDEDRFPYASASDDLLPQADEWVAIHPAAEDKSDTIKCECHEGTVRGDSGHRSGDYSDKDEKNLLVERLIEATAETVSQAALEKAQTLEFDLNEAKAQFERQHEELVKKLQESHAAELENQAKELAGHFQLEKGQLTAQLEAHKSELLQEIAHLKHVLKDTEDKLQVAQLSLEKEMQLKARLKDEFSAKIEHEKALLHQQIVEMNRELQQKDEAEVSLRKLQADKRRLERMLTAEPTDPDDVLLELDDKDFGPGPILGSAYRRDWEQSSNASDDARSTNTHLRQLLTHLIGVYVKLAKTVNKELINLLGTDLGVCEFTLTGDGSEVGKKLVKDSEAVSQKELDALAALDLEGPSPNTSVFSARTEESDDRPFQYLDFAVEDIVTEAGEKLTVAVQRLLSMLSASLMQLQESHAAHNELESTSLQSNDGLALLAAQNEELSSQMKSEMKTKECLAVELHKLTGLLKTCEAEKSQLEDTLARKERQLEQVVCQLDNAQAENDRLHDSLIEDQKQLKFHQEVIAEGIGEHAQMVKSVRTEPFTHLLATGGTELLEENTRLQHEKRGLQNRGEKDRSHLMARIQELELALEELTSSHDSILEEKQQEITDLQQQIDAIDKQLRGYKQFIDEQTAEREQEREEFQLEMNKLNEVLREKGKSKNSEEQLAREVDTLQQQMKKNEKLKQQAKEKQEQLERDVENLIEKSNHQQELIRELERQLDCKSRNEKDLGEQMEELKSVLSQTSKANEDQTQEIEELRKMSISSRMSTTIPFLEECMDIHGLDLDGPPTPESLMLELRTQMHSLEDKVCRHARDLEGLNITSSSLSSPCSEEVSVREQLDALRSMEKSGKSTGVEHSFSAYLQDVRRLEEKVEALTRGRDVVLKRMKDLEAHALKQKHLEEELLQDREVLQQKLNDQLIQISGLQARIEDRRLGVHSNEMFEKIELLQEELLKEKEIGDKKGKQLKVLQAEYSQSQEQCASYKTQVGSLLQQYNEDVSQNKASQVAANLENNELKHHNQSLKIDLDKAKQRSEELSSLLQTLTKEKNEEMDLLTSQVKHAELELEQLRELTAKQEEELKQCHELLKRERQSLAHVEEALEEKTLELEEKVDCAKQAEKETRKAWETVEQKKREVDALKVVLEEKAQLVEQVKTLQAELDDLMQYQTRLQEDFDTVQAMLEERQQDLAELTTVRDASLEEQVNLKNQLDILQKQLASRQCESFNVGIQVNEDDKDKLLDELCRTKATQEEQLRSLKKELDSALMLGADCEAKLEVEKRAVIDANERIGTAVKGLEAAQEKSNILAAELEEIRASRKPSGDELQATKDALNKTEQLKSRLEAEIAWRDTKIFRLEDEVEQIKNNISRGLQTFDGKSALQKFLEEVQNEVSQECLNEKNENVPSDAMRRRMTQIPANRNGISNEVTWSGDEGPMTSTDASISESDADSAAGDSVPPHIKSLMRKVYKDGLHLLNLSELHTLQEHASNDPSGPSFQKDMLQKAWGNEKSHLVAEIQALKDLLSQVTTIAAASRVQSPMKSSSLTQTLHFISNFLTKERDNLLAQIRSGIVSGSHGDRIDVRKLDKSITELNSLYNSLLDSIQNMKLTVETSSPSQLINDPKATLWEVQMAVAKERLKHQEDQKKLMQQLHAVDQQLAQCERQAKRQVELLEFRTQQEQIIAEDLRRSLDLEKSRSIELCSQLALEKGRASHLDLNTVQLKSELSNYQMSLEQERQEACNLMQQFKNEKSRAEALVQALQGERDSFAQLQEAMEAEKRRSKASHHREQQIIAELRQALETERDKQVELTAALEHEKLALQNARQDLGRSQRRAFEAHMQASSTNSMCLSDDGQMHDGSELGSQSTLEDVQEALELEKRKNQDLGSVLHREHNHMTLRTTAMQQERRQLLDEIESDRNTIGQLQSTIEMLQAQKSTLQKELKREKEQVHRLEADQGKMASDLSSVHNEVHQRDQEIQALRQMQRDLHKDWEVEREHERHRQRETQLELQRLQQKFVIHEKEIEFLKRNEALLKQELSEERKLVSLTKGHHLIASANTSSRYQHASLETVRERLYLLLLKAQDEFGHLFAKHSKSTFANSIGDLLVEVGNLGQETLLSPQAPEGITHLDLTERIVRHNADLVKFAIQQSEEKLSLRKALSQPREGSVHSLYSRTSSHSQSQVSNEQVFSAERAAWAQERSSLLRALHRAEADLVRTSGEARASRRSQSVTASPVSRLDEGKGSSYYFKYLRAQSFRKNLVYQKNYLLILLGGYQDTEAATLEMLGRLGCLSSAYGSHNHLHHSKAFRKFRSVVRVVTSLTRMKVLARKWNSRAVPAGFPVSPERQERDDGGFDILSSGTPSAIRAPSIHSQYHSFYPGYTPPVRDNIQFQTDSERSFSPAARRSLSLRTGSTSSSSNHSIAPLTEYVHRFDSIQQQLGI